MKQSLKETKALAQAVRDTLPERLLKGDKLRNLKSVSRRKVNDRAELDRIEASYNQLDGDWRDWLEVAKRFEHKAKAQDRLDLRHTIIVAFADQQARNERLDKPDLSFYGMLRIASHCVADYWRADKRNTMISLNTEIVDTEGNTIELQDTLADDNAIDLEAWLDAKTFKQGFPDRLIQLAVKRHKGIPLNQTDQRYFTRQRQKEWARYQKTLF